MNERLPQWLADRLGWREMAEDVARVYQSLTDAEQRNAVIITTNYGHAGALELFAPELNLPPVYATHNTYHLWGPPSDSVQTFIVVRIRPEEIASRFASVEVARVFHCVFCSRENQNIPILIARGPRFSMRELWPGFKIYS